LEAFITLKEAAAISGLSTGHLALLCKQGKLKAIKKGRDWLTTRKAVAKYLGEENRKFDPFKNRHTR
jgi:excisionase family DNA binding protein